MGYSYPIMKAIICFPFLSVLLSFPFLLYYYRKYGSISFFRFLIFFSFFFYLLCCYFLVVLPLPPRSVVASYTSRYYNLRPFYFIPDFISSDAFEIGNFKTYFLIFKEFKYLEAIFNVLMVIPFGVYLRYYFKCDFFKTIFFSFCLSLFFECTQITGLYFIYPRPYRLFDINDLINNSLGGCIGYIICPLLSFFLPSRDSLDINDYVKGSYVSIGRRFIALIIDYFLVFTLSFFIIFLFHFKHIYIIYLIVNCFYFTFISYISQGYTFGKWFLKFKNVSSRVDGYVSLFKCILKWIILHFVILNGWVMIIIYHNHFSGSIYWYVVIYLSFLCLFVFHALFSWIVKKDVFYDSILKFSSVSVIDEEDFYEEV